MISCALLQVSKLRRRIHHTLQFGIERKNELRERETLSGVGLCVHDREKVGEKLVG